MEPSKLFFPLWMMFVVPISWAAILPGIVLIALLGLFVALFCAHREVQGASGRLRAAWEDVKKSVTRACLNLCLAYCAGTLFMLAPPLLSAGRTAGALHDMAFALTGNLYESAPAVTWAVLCVAASAGISYGMARLWGFGKTGLGAPERRRAALCFALLCAPWIYLFPYRLFY